MESSNNFITLNKLLSTYEDSFFENWILFRERITGTNGFQIQLNNLQLDSLFNILETNNKIEAVAGCKYFHFINKGTGGLRTRASKGILFNDANEYEIIINKKKYIKKDNERWDSLFKRIPVPVDSSLTIKEVKTDEENLTNFIEMNYLESPDHFYQLLNSRLKTELANQKISFVQKLYKKLGFPEKITKENKENLIQIFELSRYSKNLGLLSLIETFSFELMETNETIERGQMLWKSSQKDIDLFKELLLKSPLA